jgi:hypothetical protein
MVRARRRAFARTGALGSGSVLSGATRCGPRRLTPTGSARRRERKTALAALGEKVVIAPNASPDSLNNVQNVARRMASQRGWFLKGAAD